MADSFKIIVFTAEEEFSGEGIMLDRLLRAGVDYLHIRKPDSSATYIRNLLSAIDGNSLSRVKLHDCHELIEEFPEVGFHLNTRNPNVVARHLSKSCHSLEEVKMTKGVEYVTLSPVFDSISKPGYKALNEIDGIDRIGKTVIALGGVNLDRVPQLVSQGFAGAALLGDVWCRDGGYRQLIECLRLRNMRLQYITDGPDTIAKSMAALSGGCRWIQIRMKDANDKEVAAVARALSPECRKRGATLILDDRVELASQLKDIVDGVHLGQTDMHPSDARRMLGDEMIIGLTVNDPSHLDNDRVECADYYGVGPFRFTTTKKNLARQLGLEGYETITCRMRQRKCVRPYVAIGGITLADVEPLMSAGISGIAVSGAIARASDPLRATDLFMNEINKYTPTL